MKTILSIGTSLCLLGLLASAPVYAATSAGKVVYAFGQVEAVQSDGNRRALKRGDIFGPGDTVTTYKGRAQIRFTDGGFAALQPNTEYRIEDYHYEGKADGKERSFLNLVRGSVRLVTGFIGRANKKNFRLRTSVATIGIRGTSGKVSHCDANCGELGPGTALAGYGGVWDLSSGSYSGPVTPGQATFCNGASCFDIPGFGQRDEANVGGDESELDETLDESDETIADGGVEADFQNGVQTDSSGRSCETTGSCGAEINVTVATSQVSAVALPIDGELSSTQATVDTFQQLAVIFNNGVPVAGVAGNAQVGISASTVDPAALRQAFLDFPEAQISAFGLSVLDQVPLDQLQAVTDDPASVGLGDAGLTSDGRLYKGRWENGFVLDIAAAVTGDGIFSEVRELRGLQSEHFIFGADPGPLPGSGRAVYDFTGGTFSTGADGLSRGLGVTSGRLAIDFLSGAQGALTLNIDHDDDLYQVMADVFLTTGSLFNASGFAQKAGADSYGFFARGFFASPGANAPRAAGLTYLVQTTSPFIGAAGFGLTAFRETPPIVTAPLIAGAYVSFAHAFEAPNITSNSFDFLVTGGDTATERNGFVNSFNSTTHPGLCSPACTFDAGTTAPETSSSGSYAPLGASWARFSPGYTVQHAELGTPRGSAHVVKVEVPTALANIPALGSNLIGVYNVLRGNTTPTVIFETAGTLAGEFNGSLDVATMTIDFNDGSVGASFGGSFNDGAAGGNWSLGGSSSPGTFIAAAGIHSLNLFGTVTSPQITNPGTSPLTTCASGCGLDGHTHFDVIGVDATGVAGTFEASTQTGSEPGFTVTGGYILEGSVLPGSL